MKMRFFVLAAIITSSRLFAQQDSSRILDEVVVTANKYPKKQSETGKVLTVINSKQLEQSAGRTLMEVLNTVAGVTVIGANNNAGTNQTISVRGASAGNTLILLDGIPVNDPSVITNYFDLNLLAIDQVERIEILKGGQSTLYGSDAVAGVVNIITKKAGSKAFNLTAGITGGSYNTFKQDLGISGRKGIADYSVGYTHVSSDGFSSARDITGNGHFDKDGFWQNAANARLGLQMSKSLRIIFLGQYNHYKTELDNTGFTDEKDYSVKNDQAMLGTGLVYTHNMGSLHFNYNYNYTKRAYLDDSLYKSSPYVDFSKSHYIGKTHYAELYNSFLWKNWELLTGVDFRLNKTRQVYFSTGPFGPYEPPILDRQMTQLSPYASVTYKNNRGFNVELGGRWNHDTAYGDNFTYTFNPSLKLSKSLRIFTNLYSAFKVPTLYQLYDASAGNSELKAEKASVAELGTTISPAHGLEFRIVGFYRKTKNSIQYIVIDPSSFQSQYRNISRQENYGVELEASYAIGKFSLNGNYTYTDGKTMSGYDGTGAEMGKDTTYYNLYRIPKHAINFSVGYQASKALFLRTQLHSVSKRQEFIYASTPQSLGGYALVDLYAEYRFQKSLRAFVDLKNLANTRYTDLLGYNSRRFNFMAGLYFSLK